MSSLLITTEAMIAEKPKDKAPAMPAAAWAAAWAAWTSKSHAQRSAEATEPREKSGVFLFVLARSCSQESEPLLCVLNLDNVITFRYRIFVATGESHMSTQHCVLSHPSASSLERALHGDVLGNFASLCSAVREFSPIRVGECHTTVFGTSSGPVVAQLKSITVSDMPPLSRCSAIEVNLVHDTCRGSANAIVKLREELSRQITADARGIRSKVRRNWFRLITVTGPIWMKCSITNADLQERAFRLGLRVAKR